MRKIKFRRFHIFNLSLYLLICIMCLLSLVITNSANKMNNNIKTDIEESYRKETRRVLEYFSTRLNNDIGSNVVNVWSDEDLEHWFNIELMDLRYSGSESFKMAINIGYSYDIPNTEMIEEVCNEYNLTENQTEHLKIAFLDLSLNGKTNQEINKEIQTVIEQEINSNVNFTLIDSFKNIFFEKNKVITCDKNIDITKLSNLIFRVENSEFGDDVIYQHNGQNNWVEWRSVPLSFLGFGEEAPENGDNIDYKKLVIIIGINEEQTLLLFKETFKDINSISTYSNILLVVTFIAIVLILTFKFIKTIKGECQDNQEGDIMN